ncbi:MAG TPA: hypothetical protein PKH13_08075 [Bacillota bacterium]|nr:hypothetical protein [Bacillota bacterium]
MERIEVIRQRNKLFMYLSWLSTAFSSISALAAGLGLRDALIVIVPAVLLSVSITIFCLRNILVLLTFSL